MKKTMKKIQHVRPHAFEVQGDVQWWTKVAKLYRECADAALLVADAKKRGADSREHSAVFSARCLKLMELAKEAVGRSATEAFMREAFGTSAFGASSEFGPL